MRRTKEELNTLAARLGDAVDREFYVEWAYGAPRLYEEFEGGGAREVSPRLANGALYEWMWAFLKGVEYAQRKGKKHD